MKYPIGINSEPVKSFDFQPVSRSQTYTPRRGLTLVEILVVLAIIGILSAIVFPAFGGAREAARIATCSGNLKQIYMGTQLYLRDNSGSYPDVSFGGTAYSGPTYCGWASILHPYVKSAAVFECPNAENGEFRNGCPPDLEGNGDTKILWDGSYDFNILRVSTRPYIRESLVSQPSQVMLFSDGSGVTHTPYGPAMRTSPEASFDNRYEWAVLDMKNLALTERGHNEGFNICFADGHVKRVSANDFNSRDLWLNTRDAEYKLRAP